MTDYALAAGRHRLAGGIARRALVWLSILAMVGLAGAPIAYMLWPQAKPVSPDAPSLPITVAGVAFNVPPAAIRFKMQRRAGPQSRVDLAFLWPSLEPPLPATAVTPADAPKVTERIFVTIAGSDGTLPPGDRLKSIYPRYVATGPAVDMGGLQVRAFRERHALSGRGPDLRSCRARALADALHADVRGHAGHVPARAPARRRRRHGALSARLARRLARRRDGHRPSDREASGRAARER